jgi:hypothetical protein
MDIFVSARMDDGNRTAEGVGEPRSVPRVGESLRTEGSQKMLRSNILFASRYPLNTKSVTRGAPYRPRGLASEL